MKNWLFGLCVVAALALMMSEGEYFPFPNLVGAGVLIVVAACLPRASNYELRMTNDEQPGGPGRDFQRRGVR